MRVNDQFYRELLDSVFDGVYTVDRDVRIEYWNKGAERISGYTSSEIVGSRCSDNVLAHVDESGTNLCASGCPVTCTLSDGLSREAKVYLHHKNGHRVPVTARVLPIWGPEGQIDGAVEVFTDDTPTATYRHAVEQLEKLAMTDPLTELGNRRSCEANLTSRFEQLRRYGWPFGVVSIDVDRFKSINDTYGHDVGDKTLVLVAKTLRSGLRSFDTVARWGGEEFVAIITNVDQEQLGIVADKLRARVEQSSLEVDSKTVRPTISLGATLARSDDTLETLLKRADELMYQSKLGGRNRVSLG